MSVAMRTHTVLARRLDAAVQTIEAAVGTMPRVGIVLGSGLGGLVERMAPTKSVPYQHVPHWPPSSVEGHAGVLHRGKLAGVPIVALAGRAHLYEGHDADAVAFAVRVLARAGVRVMILTNAAGGLNPSWPPGTLMVIDDHLNLTGRNPLVGPNDPALGPRFPDMSAVYAPHLRQMADEVAAARGITVTHGVYAGLLGPSYETPAEVRALASLGASAVGMSTVLEAIALRHVDVDVLGISCITNLAAGLGPGLLSHAEVAAAATSAGAVFADLLEGIVERL